MLALEMEVRAGRRIILGIVFSEVDVEPELPSIFCSPEISFDGEHNEFGCGLIGPEIERFCPDLTASGYKFLLAAETGYFIIVSLECQGDVAVDEVGAGPGHGAESGGTEYEEIVAMLKVAIPVLGATLRAPISLLAVLEHLSILGSEEGCGLHLCIGGDLTHLRFL